jgi:hypothetical protein
VFQQHLLYQRRVEVVPPTPGAKPNTTGVYAEVALSVRDEYGTVQLAIDSKEVCQV